MISLRERETEREGEREKPQISEQKLTFNITYYPAFQNVRTLMEELNISLAPNKENKKVFPNVPVVGFWNRKSLKDFLVRATLPKLNKGGSVNHVGKKLV